LARYRPTGLELASRVAGELSHGDAADPEELELAATACIDALQRVQESAARNSYGMGGVPSPYLAAYLATHVSIGEIWDPLLAFLLDARVSASDKELAMSGLNARPDGIPAAIRQTLIARWAEVSIAQDDAMFGAVESHFAASRLRLGLSIGSISHEDFIAGVTRLACGSAKAQID
jgi:hypothetical protein